MGRLAVFRGSFSLQAAEVICHPKAMELLGPLVAKSLVSVSDGGEEVRYRPLESVRIYAEQKLVETGESEELRSAHRDWYLEWIESLPVEALGGSPVVAEADNLTVALEWCRQQGRHDLCARIALRMAAYYWFNFVRLGEMMAWWQELDAGLPAEDRDHRAMACWLRAQAARLAGEWDELNAYSARASALADPHSLVAMGALYLQAVYWSMIDPPRGDRLFERFFEMLASIGMAPEPFSELFYISRLGRANSRHEALALLGDWLTDLGDSTPTHAMPGLFALYGNTRTALELTSRLVPGAVPFARYVEELAQAVLASARGLFDEAEQHMGTLTSVVRDHAVPGGEAGCVIGFAKIALDRGDYPRASRLLAAVKANVGTRGRPLRPFDALIYDHCTKVVQEVLGPESGRTSEAEGAALSLKEALDSELSRIGTTATVNPAE